MGHGTQSHTHFCTQIQKSIIMEELKASGNAAFKKGDFASAVDFFTRAIDAEKTLENHHVLYSNRSAARAGNNEFDLALEDAEKVIELKPDFVKGYGRKGAALFGKGEFDLAKKAYEDGLKVDGSNETCKNGVQECEQKLDEDSKFKKLFTDPQTMVKLMTDPKTKAYFQQEDFMKIFAELQKDCSGALQKHMQDPRVMDVLSVALGLNITGAPPAAAAAQQQQQQQQQQTKAPPEPAKPKKKTPEEIKKEEEANLPENKRKALKLKEEGNKFYKKRDFEKAVKKYEEAIESDPTDPTYINNRAAVRFEQGDFDKCIEDCEKSIEVGRENRSDYRIVAKAMARKASAYEKMDNLTEAIEWYQRSLTEHREASTLNKLNSCEKKLKDKEIQAYLNPELGEKARDEGNELFKNQDFPNAVAKYTEAIKRNPTDHKSYSNRSACYTKLAAFNEALKDAEKCIEIDPTFVKGYSRKGHVEFFTKQYDKALETYQAGLKIDPANEELKDGARRCVMEQNKAASGMLTEEELKSRQENAMKDPEIQSILADPVMNQVLRDMSENPQAAMEHQKNPMIMAKVRKLINAGIVQTR